MAALWARTYPYHPIVGRRPFLIRPTPLNDAQTIADAAGVLGGLGGILAAVLIGAPILTGAIAGILVVGVAAGIYASFTNITASEFDTAVAEGAWPSADIGAAGDLARSLKLVGEYRASRHTRSSQVE